MIEFLQTLLNIDFTAHIRKTNNFDNVLHTIRSKFRHILIRLHALPFFNFTHNNDI